MSKDFAFNATMDQHNNAIGRLVFMSHQAIHPGNHLSVDQIIPKIYQEYTAGKYGGAKPKSRIRVKVFCVGQMGQK